MEIIIDNNVLFSLMKPNSTNSKLFYILKSRFISPEFIKQEFKKYEKECFLKAGISNQEFEKRKKDVFQKIEFIEFSHYNEYKKEAVSIIKDIDYWPYIALALKKECPIWSNDSELRQQSKVKVLSTEDIIEIVF